MAKIQNPTNARHIEHNDGQRRNIARKGGVAKRTNDGVALHPGMTRQQKDAAGLGGMGHAVVADGGQPGAPLPHAYGSAADLKTGKAVAPVPGQRSRTNEDCADKSADHGRDVIAEAVRN
jgi:hypothetical protein